jgi:superfamily II DNA or RNA helicase
LPSVTGIHGSVEIQKVVPHNTACREIFRFDGSLAFAEMITALSEDSVRNNMIVSILNHLATTRHKIIVVSSLVQHCCVLAEAFQLKNPSVPVARMAGKFQDRELALARSTKVVFATYSLLEEGYDDIYLDTLVLVTPRSRIQQTIGRIERTHADKLRPLVIDIVDPYSVFPQMWYKRCVFYRSRGFLIEDTSK